MLQHRRGRSDYQKRLSSKSQLSTAEFNSVIKEYFLSLNSPVALSCWLLYEAGEFVQLVEKEINPMAYNCKLQFRVDFAAISFLRKSEFLKTNIDKRKVAIDAFKASEMQCSLTNRRFRNLSLDPQFKGSNVWLLNATIRKIAQILEDPFATDGENQTERGAFVEEFLDSGAFGPGATTSLTGQNTSAERKFREERQITSSLYLFVGPLLERAYPLWYREGCLAEVEIREESKVITVPKSAKTDRTIAVEPGLNTWFQKAIGRMIRTRLRRNGLDLNTDRRNQAAAKTGSIDNSLATVDFSAASDTISRELVRELIPRSWYLLMDSARSASYVLDGSSGRFEKFSSMGNGFTFELESLIFYAAACACTEYCGFEQKAVLTFGDDVVVPSGAYDQFVEFSRFLGFTVNPRKSFSSGYFRESCGAYFFNGLSVKPLFLKKDLNHAANLVAFANSLRDIAHAWCNNLACDNRFEELYLHTTSVIPSAFRLLGERSGGAGCIHSNFDECCPSYNTNGFEGFSFKALVYTAVTCETDHPSLLVARVGNKLTEESNLQLPFLGQGQSIKKRWTPALADRIKGNEETLRSVTRMRKTRIFVQQWYNFGPWV